MGVTAARRCRRWFARVFRLYEELHLGVRRKDSQAVAEECRRMAAAGIEEAAAAPIVD